MPSIDHLSDPQDAEFLLEHPNAQSIHTLEDQTKADFGDFLVVSPYTFQPHLLDLRRLESSQNLLARALTLLEPVRTDYATAPYHESFNWASVIDHLRFLNEEASHCWSWQHFYIVVFRSQVPPTTNRVELGELDEKAHAEATQSGGLLKYWFGTPDEDGRNLATCIWRKQQDARPGSVGPGHKAAARATSSMYTEWEIERLAIVIEDGVKKWSIVPWEGLTDQKS